MLNLMNANSGWQSWYTTRSVSPMTACMQVSTMLLSRNALHRRLPKVIRSSRLSRVASKKRLQCCLDVETGICGRKRDTGLLHGEAHFDYLPEQMGRR